MKIIIAEDEIAVAEHLKRIVEKIGFSVIRMVQCGEDVLSAIEFEIPDLVLLDINMSHRTDGINTAEKLNRLGVPFVFITAHSDAETVDRVTRLKPLGYIVKPFISNQIRVSLTTIYGQIKERVRELHIGKEKFRFHSGSILYIKSDNNYCEIITSEKRYVLRVSLKNLIELLDFKDIVRVHRSYAVNKQHVVKVDNKTVQIAEFILPKTLDAI
ncbi:LytR/AlgR family response regulator transcription factor [Luteibaculum oceani]|uniref:Response regulator transcription factor n=1 Tax=Luteibaculum oceani TaxID=1294296 RepID=A0A5C6UTW2_9FLAO|nr:response regulator transcription factor [Luteibaculum oceani]TXC76064.1 response regulator transcription factor [Luteibaculum oceani]